MSDARTPDAMSNARTPDAASGARTPDAASGRRTPDASGKRGAGHRADQPVEVPRFWFGFEVAWAKLAAARLIVFGLLALDAFLQLRHAGRYGAGDFNVAQLPLLDALGPGRVSYTVGQLLEAYLFALVALGIATRLLLPIATTIYAWLYFGSQLDSYQHHYLVVIVLAIACFVPWQRPRDATGETRVRAWALRLVLVQLAIMYVWAAISKLDVAWLDGRTLARIATGSLRAAIDRTIGVSAAAVLVVVGELTLAATVWVRPGWRVAAPLGILFHLGILAMGLEIGLFAYLMLGLYVLVLPDALLVALARTGPARAMARLAERIGRLPAVPALGVAAAVGLALAWFVRIEQAFVVAVAVTPVLVALVALARWRHSRPPSVIAAAHVLALTLWVVCDRATSVAVDHYNRWAGAQRRLGNVEQAERAYRSLLAIGPELGHAHYHLGRILLASNRAEEGLVRLHDAQRLEPRGARAWMAEARWLAATGRRDEAITKAKRATFAEPSNSAARKLLDALLAGSTPASVPVDDDPEVP